jgi:hypothetical protein
MANEKILLNAEAKKLGIEGYRQMTPEELKGAISRAKTGSKGKTAAKSAVSTAKGKVSASAPKGKAAASTAPAKGKSTSTSRKSAPAKGTAAKGTAKRASSTTTKTAPARGKTTTAKAPAAKKAPAKTSKAKAGDQARSAIDLKGINWKAESNVGKTGKRKEVLDSLKRTKSYAKTFEALKDRARKFYPGKTKHDAERTLVWLIGRVAYDFAMSTDQHTPGVRAGYGESDKPQDIRRRARRAESSGTSKTKTAAKTTARGKAAGKTTTPAKRSTASPARGKAPAKRPASTTRRAAPAMGKSAPAVRGRSAASKGRAVKGVAATAKGKGARR